MHKIKLLVTGALLAGAMGVVMPGVAGQDGKQCQSDRHMSKGEFMGGKHAGHRDGLGRALDLTEEQKEAMKTRREANKAEHNALRDQVQQARKALNTAAETGANDAEMNALAEALGQLQAKQALAGAKNHQAFLSLLTDEQKKTLQELQSKRLERQAVRLNKPDNQGS